MKRFTETDKWRDPWFRRLSGSAKLLWLYILDHCDKIGLVEIDEALASQDCGQNITPDTLKELESRLQCCGNGKFFIPKFISFQYGTLTEHCPPHRTVLKLVNTHCLVSDGIFYHYPKATLALGHKTRQEEDKKKTRQEGEQKITKADPPAVLETTAEDIYEAYPLKVGKPVALRAIQKAMAKLAPELLLQKTKQFAASRKGDSSFVPHPATWFNQDRFNDDPATWVRCEVMATKKSDKPW